MLANLVFFSFSALIFCRTLYFFLDRFSYATSFIWLLVAMEAVSVFIAASNLASSEKESATTTHTTDFLILKGRFLFLAYLLFLASCFIFCIYYKPKNIKHQSET